jgi:hypothetical protein
MTGSSGQAVIVNGVVAPQDAPFLQANQSAVSGARGFREAIDVAAAQEKNIDLKQLDRDSLGPASACCTNAQASGIRVSPIETQGGALEFWESQGTDDETYELLDSRIPEAYVSGKQLPAMDRQSLPVDVQFAGSGRESGNSPVANAGSASAISTLVAKSNGSAANSEITSKIGESALKDVPLRQDSSARAIVTDLSSTGTESRRFLPSGGETRIGLMALTSDHGVAGNSRHQPIADQSGSSVQLATNAQLATNTMAEGSQLLRTPLGINDLNSARMTRMSLDSAAVAAGSGSERATSLGLNRGESLRGQLERTRLSQTVDGEGARKGIDSALRLAKVEALVSELSSSAPRQVMAQSSTSSLLHPGHAAANPDPSLAATSSGSLLGQLAPKSLMPFTASASGIVNAKIDSAAWMEQIANHAKMAIKQDLRSVEIKLTPAHLGTIEILVAQDDESTQLAFFTKHAHVRDALESQLSRLQKFFQEDGLELSDAWVSDQSLAEHRERQSAAEHGDDRPGGTLADVISAQESVNASADQRQKPDPDRQLDVWA